MPRNHLDKKLLGKLAGKISKSIKYTREQISKRAAKKGISSEAVLILWSKEFGIGTTHFQRSLPPYVQEEVRDNLPGESIKPVKAAGANVRGRSSAKQKPDTSLRFAIDTVLSDKELRERCGDLLRARGNFDRVFREATTVLDHRLKTLGNIKTRMNPVDLTGKVLNSNPSRAILVVSDDGDQQEGFFSLCKGIFLAFRNPAHHHLSDKVTREDALRFCGFVDLVLSVLSQARQNPTP